MHPGNIFDEIDRMEREFFGGFMGRQPERSGFFPGHQESNYMHDRFAGNLHRNMMDEMRREFGFGMPDMQPRVVI